MAELNKQGWAAQLRHIQEETTWESHGFVKLRDAATDAVLAETADLQHNWNFRKNAELAKELVKSLPPPPAPAAKAKEPAEEGEEASTKANSDTDEASLKASDEEASIGGKA